MIDIVCVCTMIDVVCVQEESRSMVGLQLLCRVCRYAESSEVSTPGASTASGDREKSRIPVLLKGRTSVRGLRPPPHTRKYLPQQHACSCQSCTAS